MNITLNWPIAALIFGVIAILIFRTEIGAKIRGITRAGKDGVTFERPQEGGGDAQPPLLPFEEVMKHPMSSTALEREKFVENQLNNLGFRTEAEKTAAMVRVFAVTRIELEFNNIAHAIFGSQVSLLVQISGTRNGVTKQETLNIFEAAKNNFPELYNNRDFNEWLAYLVNNNLVALNEDKIDITQFGKDFLKHLVDTRQAHQRYG